MAEFLKGDKLNYKLVEIFENAKDSITIISPFIKLHSRIKDALLLHIDNPKVQITVVFGKNEENKSKSLNMDEFNFFKKFPNIKINYEPRLHAKYYANENYALLSSMNLYEYSQNNNIEFGILTSTNLLNSITNLGSSLDQDAYSYFDSVIKSSKEMFLSVPQYEQKMMGLSKKFTHSDIETDLLSTELTSPKPFKKKAIPSTKPKASTTGYCIRTGTKIPFNPEKPFSGKAFESWIKFKDESYSEKYCHYSGEPSDGETTYAKPILRKNWKKSQTNS